MRLVFVLLGLAIVTTGLAWSLGCCSAPVLTSLPEDESAIRVVDTQGSAPGKEAAAAPGWSAPAGEAHPEETAWSEPGEAPSAEPASPHGDAPRVLPAAHSPTTPVPTPVPVDVSYSELALAGVKGGQVAFAVPGTPEDVVAMLLDFPRAAGNRSWAESFRVLEQGPDGVLVEWRFKGKIFKPTVQLRFRTEKRSDATVLRFSLEKKQLGVASFFGDYRVTQLQGSPPRSRIVERTFIDSGIAFRPVKSEEVEQALREDARLMRAWMEARLK